MNDQILSISLDDLHGKRLWELDDLPPPEDINGMSPVYKGQRNIENLLKTVNQKVYREKDERLLPYLYLIYERSLEQGVSDEGTIQWDDRFYYTRISWTAYSWKLPQEIKRRKVSVEITKIDDPEKVQGFDIPLSKIADAGGDIHIASRMVSKMNFKIGDPVMVRIRFTD